MLGFKIIQVLQCVNISCIYKCNVILLAHTAFVYSFNILEKHSFHCTLFLDQKLRVQRSINMYNKYA